MRFEAAAIHAGDMPDAATGTIPVPICQTSTSVFEDVGKTRGWDYSRTADPTRKVLEDTVAQLEGGRAGFAFAIGMAAETTVMHLLRTGDHVISGDDVYGGTYRLFQDVMTSFGLELTFLRMNGRLGLYEAIRPNTRMLWLTPISAIRGHRSDMNLPGSRSKHEEKHTIKLFHLMFILARYNSLHESLMRILVVNGGWRFCLVIKRGLPEVIWWRI